MLMPSIFGESFLDDFFDFPFENRFQTAGTGTELMKTDIKDTEDGYEVTMNLPGVKKEDVKAELKDGYLTISASANSNRTSRIPMAATSAESATAAPAAEAFT